MMKNILWILVLGLSLPSFADQDSEEVLREQLTRVNQEVEDLGASLQTISAEMWEKQRELSYNNPEIKKAYQKIRSLESELVGARKQLDLLLSMNGEYQAIETKRKNAFRDLAARKAVRDQIVDELSRFE